MNWYYLENGVQRGPITEAEFPGLVQVGVIGPHTRLWCEGMTGWKEYRELLETGISSVPALKPATEPSSVTTEEPTRPASEPIIQCSQCGAEVPASQTLLIGSASLCPKCQVGYRRQAQIGFGDRPAEYAGPFVRLGAFILDLILCSAIAVGLAVGGQFAARRFFPDNDSLVNRIYIALIILICLWPLDYFIGRVARDGATPAMKLLRIKIVPSKGGKVGGLRAIYRLICIGLTNSLTLGFGHLLVFFDKRRRSLHDLVCGTVVVKSV